MSLELTFCCSPNAIGIAAVMLSFEDRIGSESPNIPSLIGLTSEQLTKVLEVKSKLYQVRQK